jgi:hypothetical protein
MQDYHIRKSPWTSRRAEDEWEGQTSDGWMDGVMRDAERLGVRNLNIKVKDRDGWRRLLESAKTLHGL